MNPLMRLNKVFLARALKVGENTNTWFGIENGYDITLMTNGFVLIIDKLKCCHIYAGPGNITGVGELDWKIKEGLKHDKKSRRSFAGTSLVRTKSEQDTEPINESIQEPS